MKSYRLFIGFGLLMLVLYIVAQLNKPQPLDWTLTLSKADKKPYGSYILYEELKKLFPEATIASYREPVYNRLHNIDYQTTAYFCFAPVLSFTQADVDEVCRFVEQGNSIFISAEKISKTLLDTLGLKKEFSFLSGINDSCVVQLTNAKLDGEKKYLLHKLSSASYFSEINKPDSTLILGKTTFGNPNFVKVHFGKGDFFIHITPHCFTNYFLLNANNIDYVSKALSYLPATTKTVMWDEYYKQGRGGPQTPLRFFLSNTFLRWALWIGIIGLITFVLFERKRTQRIIPVIEPLKNQTLDFVKTVAGVYYNQRDNYGIAQKKIQYWLEFIRIRFYLNTQVLDEHFKEQLLKKSGVEETLITTIMNFANALQTQKQISDVQLLEIGQKIDSFYKQAK